MTISLSGCERGPAKPGLAAIAGESLLQAVSIIFTARPKATWHFETNVKAG